jgi:pyruvate dehydrogenase E1 component alpha subunit
LAQKLKKTGRVVTFITGDGTLAKGNYHEVFTTAALFKLPIIFVIRANGWAMSTSIEKSVAFKRVSDMAAAYQIPASIIDGNDALAVRDEVKKAADYARGGNGPVFIEATTYRMAAHSSRDEDDYRPAEDKQLWAAKDPILLMERIMLRFGFEQAEIDAIENDTRKRVADAFEKCKALPSADINEVLEKEKSVVNHIWGRK